MYLLMKNQYVNDEAKGMLRSAKGSNSDRLHKYSLGAGRELVEGISGDDMATDEAHWRIALSRLLPQYWAGKYGVVAG